MATFAAELVLLASFVIVSAHLGLGRLSVAGPLSAYAVGVGLTVAASVIDGFITPDVAAHYAGGSPAEIDAGALQDLTKVGMAAMSAAIAVWSLVLFEQPWRGARPLALFGIASSVFAVAVLASASRIAPHLLLLTIAAQTLWYAGVGIAVASLQT